MSPPAKPPTCCGCSTSFHGFDLLYTGLDLSIQKTAAILITTADRSLCR